MRRALVLTILVTLLFAAFGVPSATERSDVPDRYKWKISDIFPTEAAWQKAKEDVAARVPEVAVYQGRLGESASVLYEALSTLMDVRLDLDRVSTYANMLRDEDTRVSHSVEMAQSARQVRVALRTASSYIRPELLALGADTIWGFVKKDPRLEEYRPWLDDILRYAPHTLTPPEEKVAAQAGIMSGAGATFHSTFTDAELPYPEVTLTDGETVRLDAQGYVKYRATANREDRMRVFHAFWGRYRDFRRTLAASLYAQVQTHMFDKDVHHYDSCLAASLFANNIPVEVYHQLLDDVHANLPTLHRYLRLKQKMLGLDRIGYEDLYAPSVKSVDLRYTPEQAEKLVLGATRILGKDYVDVLGHGFQGGWMDLMPSTGKSSGAYSTMVYGVHPYQLINFGGDYDAVSTVAHESGHSMHSYLSAEHQPFVTSDYSIFVAEVASTLNENLLLYSMLDKAKDTDEKLFLLGSALENFRTTLFRQAMFAEFELDIHEMAENGQPLTGDNLDDLYLKLLRTYYGADQGVCNVDSLYAVEWAYIPHFYYDFYLYQYSTSFVAGTSLAQGIRDSMAKGDTSKRDAYLHMLSSGSSKYPIQLLKDAGVDMTTPAPFAAATREMNDIMDRMESLLSGEGGHAPPGTGGQGGKGGGR